MSDPATSPEEKEWVERRLGVYQKLRLFSNGQNVRFRPIADIGFVAALRPLPTLPRGFGCMVSGRSFSIGLGRAPFAIADQCFRR